jgi:hypothetical protein
MSYKTPINIYFDGEYYYGEHGKGKPVEKNVSIDYAYDYCAKYNYGAKVSLGNRKADHRGSGSHGNIHNLKPLVVGKLVED